MALSGKNSNYPYFLGLCSMVAPLTVARPLEGRSLSNDTSTAAFLFLFFWLFKGLGLKGFGVLRV
jgi:hypothetical protein